MNIHLKHLKINYRIDTLKPDITRKHVGPLNPICNPAELIFTANINLLLQA